MLLGLVTLVEKCSEKGITEEALMSLSPEAFALLYSSDLLVSGTGYKEIAGQVNAVLSAVLHNHGTDDLGPGSQNNFVQAAA